MTSILRNAIDTVADALAASVAMQTYMGLQGEADPVVATRERVKHADGGPDLVPPYVLLTGKAGPVIELASGLRQREIQVTGEVWIPPPDGAEPEDDFDAAVELDAVADDLWEQHHAGDLLFELTAVEIDEAIRDEDNTEGADEIGNRIVVSLEAYDDA